jgi:hypothetical protein
MLIAEGCHALRAGLAVQDRLKPPPSSADDEVLMQTTRSEQARHCRAELETIIASMNIPELTAMVLMGRRLLERDEAFVPAHDARTRQLEP